MDSLISRKCHLRRAAREFVDLVFSSSTPMAQTRRSCFSYSRLTTYRRCRVRHRQDAPISAVAGPVLPRRVDPFSRPVFRALIAHFPHRLIRIRFSSRNTRDPEQVAEVRGRVRRPQDPRRDWRPRARGSSHHRAFRGAPWRPRAARRVCREAPPGVGRVADRRPGEGRGVVDGSVV